MASTDTIILFIVVYHAAIGGGQEPRGPLRTSLVTVPGSMRGKAVGWRLYAI